MQVLPLLASVNGAIFFINNEIILIWFQIFIFITLHWGRTTEQTYPLPLK